MRKKSIPLAGRLAIQLQMLTPRDVERAIAESASSGSSNLVQVFLEMRLLDRAQVAKLAQVHRELVEKRRAREAAAEAEQPDSARDRQVHAAAAHAAEAAAPMKASEVADLRETPLRRASDPRPTPASARAASPDAGSGAKPIGRIELQSSAALAPAAPTRPAASTGSTGPTPAAAAAPAPMPTPVESSGVPSFVTAARPEDGRLSLELSLPGVQAGDREKLEAILAAGVSSGASDIHLHAGGPLKHRIHGRLETLDETITAASVERMVCAALTDEQRGVLAHDGEIDFCFDLPGVGRFRANAYRQQRGLDTVFRALSDHPPTLQELGLPADLERYTHYYQGMVLVTGPAGCGKSSTLAALVNHINESREDHILTIEDPIEILHPSKRSLVNQRHAGKHTASFSRALRGALREDPDIIVIGELRDLETISLAMTAAETGHLVIASLHTSNAVRTVNRMIGAFPSNEQDQARAMISESLRAVISQRLVPTADGQGRVPALELLVNNRAIGNLIRDEKTVQIRSSMQTGRSHGMYLLEQSLNDLVAAGKITRDTALALAEEKKLITAGA